MTYQELAKESLLSYAPLRPGRRRRSLAALELRSGAGAGYRRPRRRVLVRAGAAAPALRRRRRGGPTPTGALRRWYGRLYLRADVADGRHRRRLPLQRPHGAAHAALRGRAAALGIGHAALGAGSAAAPARRAASRALAYQSHRRVRALQRRPLAVASARALRRHPRALTAARARAPQLRRHQPALLDAGAQPRPGAAPAVTRRQH